MPKVGDKQTLSDGRTIYRHKDGWGFDPLGEDEIADSALTRGERKGGGFGKETDKVESKKDKASQDFLRESTLGIAADVVGGPFGRAAVKAGGGAVKRLALELLGGSVAGASASAGVAALQGRPDVNPIDEALTDRAMDLGFRGALSGAKYAYSGAKSLYKDGVRGTLARKIAEREPLTASEASDAIGIRDFAKEYGLPLPVRSLISSFPDSVLSNKSRKEFLDQVAKATDLKILPDAVTSTNIGLSPNQNAATDIVRTKIQAEHKVAKSLESAAWTKASGLIDSNVQTIAKMVPSELLDQAGNPMMIPTPIDIAGPVNVTQHVKKIQELRAAIDEIDAQVSVDPVTKGSLTSLRNMMASLTNLTDDITGATYVPFSTSKEIRAALSDKIDLLPVVSTTGKQIRGLANSLRSSLKKAEEASASSWSPETQLAWAEAKNLTKTNAQRFNSPDVRKLVADENFSTGEGHNLDAEAKIISMLGSANGMENLVRAAGSNKEAGSLFVKIGLDRARKENGTFDPAKLDEYFQGPFGKSILDSKEITPTQRRAIKGLISYTKRNNFADINPTPNIPYLDGKMITSGIIVGGTLLGSALTGNPLASAGITGVGVLAAIPLGRKFLTKVIMDDAGAELFTKMIYAQTTQQKMRTQRNLLDYALSQGVRAWARYPDGKEEMLNSNEE